MTTGVVIPAPEVVAGWIGAHGTPAQRAAVAAAGVTPTRPEEEEPVIEVRKPSGVITPELVERVKASQEAFPMLGPRAAAQAWLAEERVAGRAPWVTAPQATRMIEEHNIAIRELEEDIAAYESRLAPRVVYGLGGEEEFRGTEEEYRGFQEESKELAARSKALGVREAALEPLPGVYEKEYEAAVAEGEREKAKFEAAQAVYQVELKEAVDYWKGMMRVGPADQRGIQEWVSKDWYGRLSPEDKAVVDTGGTKGLRDYWVRRGKDIERFYVTSKTTGEILPNYKFEALPPEYQAAFHGGGSIALGQLSEKDLQATNIKVTKDFEALPPAVQKNLMMQYGVEVGTLTAADISKEFKGLTLPEKAVVFEGWEKVPAGAWPRRAPATGGEFLGAVWKGAKEDPWSLVPVYGTVRGVIRGDPLWSTALSGLVDVAILLPPIGLVARGAYTGGMVTAKGLPIATRAGIAARSFGTLGQEAARPIWEIPRGLVTGSLSRKGQVLGFRESVKSLFGAMVYPIRHPLITTRTWGELVAGRRAIAPVDIGRYESETFGRTILGGMFEREFGARAARPLVVEESYTVGRYPYEKVITTPVQLEQPYRFTPTISRGRVSLVHELRPVAEERFGMAWTPSGGIGGQEPIKGAGVGRAPTTATMTRAQLERLSDLELRQYFEAIGGAPREAFWPAQRLPSTLPRFPTGPIPAVAPIIPGISPTPVPMAPTVPGISPLPSPIVSPFPGPTPGVGPFGPSPFVSPIPGPRDFPAPGLPWTTPMTPPGAMSVPTFVPTPIPTPPGMPGPAPMPVPWPQPWSWPTPTSIPTPIPTIVGIPPPPEMPSPPEEPPPPLIIPPFLFPSIGGLRKVKPWVLGRKLKGLLGKWDPIGYPVIAPHPITAGPVGYRFFEEPFRYGAIPKRKMRVSVPRTKRLVV